MNMKTLPIAELRSLLAAVSEHGKQHLIEVDTDLQQTSFLLSEAIEKLGVGFMAIYDTVSQQQVLIDTLTEKYHLDASDIEKLATFKTKVGEEVNSTVTGLQFQDLTSQLIARTIKRVNGLKELLEELSKHSQDIDPCQEHEEIVQYLEKMNVTLHASSDALSGGLNRRSVSQKDMTSGDIDLF